MNEEDFQKLKNISSSLKKLNTKIKLLALLERAKSAYDENRLSECESTCREILKENPKNSTALRGIGCVFQAKGDSKNAIKYYLQALDASDKKEIEYTLIGTVYYNENNFEEAIKYYNLAIDANDDYDQAYEGRSQSILERHLEVLDMQDSLIQRNIFK
jgi:tetratricopeptide (TPR) repeat protein